jgi:hypothetical protein
MMLLASTLHVCVESSIVTSDWLMMIVAGPTRHLSLTVVECSQVLAAYGCSFDATAAVGRCWWCLSSSCWLVWVDLHDQHDAMRALQHRVLRCNAIALALLRSLMRCCLVYWLPSQRCDTWAYAPANCWSRIQGVLCWCHVGGVYWSGRLWMSTVSVPLLQAPCLLGL